MPSAQNAEPTERTADSRDGTAAITAPRLCALTADRKRWVDFMMRFELGLEKPDRRRAPLSALTIGGSYVVGGLVPLIPYMLISDSARALYFSAASTLLALFVFGAVKAALTGVSWVSSAIQTILTGGIAATAAFLIARAVNAH